MRLGIPSLRRVAAVGGIIISAVLAVGLAAPPAQAQGTIRGAGHADAVPGSYIVVLKEDVNKVNKNEVAAQASKLTNRYGGKVGFVYDAALNGFSATMSETAARRLAAHPSVKYVEQDAMVSIEAQNNPTWGLDRIDQRSSSLNSFYDWRNTASNVRIYILDTGVRLTHNEFGGRAFTGFDAITSGGSATDCNGHGTHVAATAAGATYGVAKQARIYSVRVLNCSGSGSKSQIVAGVNWVTNNAVKPAVANMSLGAPGTFNGAIDDAVNNSINRGITYVVSAGNDNGNACDKTPARVAAAITVASTTSTDARSSFSNWGSCVDIFAPGSSILSARHTSDTATITMSGTSMAAPHVAGAAAIILSANPTWTTGAVQRRLYGDATNNVVGDPKGSPNRLLYAGTASTKPIITRLHCESGNSQFLCSVSHHTWSGTVSHSWKLNGTTVPAWNGQTFVNGSCTSGTVLQAVVSNSQGSSTENWSSCRTGPWL